MELPIYRNDKVTKKIAPELINQKFMWVDDYFHYRDWQKAMTDTFDSFNLFLLPTQNNSFKYFYNKGTMARIIPQGIFPNPLHKREIKTKPVSQYMSQLTTTANLDELNEMQRNPLKLLVSKELQRSTTLKEYDRDMSFMVNLQNIKQGLKADYTDDEILALICVNTHFTDRLINEHLGLEASNPNYKAVFIERDPREFREFISRTYQSKDQEDPFTHFYIKEAGKVERVHQVYADLQDKEEELRKRFGDGETFEKAKNSTL